MLNPTTLVTAEGSGMSVIDLTGTTGRVRTISTGFDGIATFAMWGGNAWLVENQGDHFWNPDAARTARPRPSRSGWSRRRSHRSGSHRHGSVIKLCLPDAAV